MKEKKNSRERQQERYGAKQAESRRNLKMTGKKRNVSYGNHRIRGALAVTLAVTAGTCLTAGMFGGVQAMAQTGARTRVQTAAGERASDILPVLPGPGEEVSEEVFLPGLPGRFGLWEDIVEGGFPGAYPDPEEEESEGFFEEPPEEYGQECEPDPGDEDAEESGEETGDGLTGEDSEENEDTGDPGEGNEEELREDQDEDAGVYGEVTEIAEEVPDGGEAAGVIFEDTEEVDGIVGDYEDMQEDDPCGDTADEEPGEPEIAMLKTADNGSEKAESSPAAKSIAAPGAELVIANPAPAPENVSGLIEDVAGEDAAVYTGDVTEPEIRIRGVEDGQGYAGDVVPEIEVYDRNFSNCEITLTRTNMDETDADVTELFFSDWELSDNGGEILGNALERTRDNDGIYTLHVRVTDEAGNETEETLTFSVNRFGSVYVFDDYLISLIDDGGTYTQEVVEDLVITEYNVDELVEGTRRIDITRDGKPVEDVMSELSVSSDGWHEYRYVIGKENFRGDGVYKLSLHSEDEAGNTSDAAETTGWEIIFRVDHTAPEITGNVKTDEYGLLAEGENFEYAVYDTMGIKSVEIYSGGEDAAEEITDFSDDPNNYSGTLFVEGAASEQEVRLVATDLAGNITEVRYAVPAGVRTLREMIASPGAALTELGQGGIMLTCFMGAAAAAAVMLILLLVRKKPGSGMYK